MPTFEILRGERRGGGGAFSADSARGLRTAIRVQEAALSLLFDSLEHLTFIVHRRHIDVDRILNIEIAVGNTNSNLSNLQRKRKNGTTDAFLEQQSYNWTLPRSIAVTSSLRLLPLDHVSDHGKVYSMHRSHESSSF
jgi:hypothetical protein